MDSSKLFSGKAEVYERHRPSYPAELIDYYYQEVGFTPHSVIADMGAGTGLMSRLLLLRGSRVLCVEPNQDMRVVAMEKLGESSRCRFISAPAETTGLPAHSVDYVTAAQSFHWFHQAEFAAECRRILRPDGKVALVWNSLDREDALAREIWMCCKQGCPGFPGFSGGEETLEGPRGFFRGDAFEKRVFPNDLSVDLPRFLGRYLSASYAPKPGEYGYGEFVESLTGLFERYQRSGRACLRGFAHSCVGKV